MQKQSALIKCNIGYSNLVSDILRSVKITANDQNDKIHCYFVIKKFKVRLNS